jgi:predicted HicB family RNase H-like nuclease
MKGEKMTINLKEFPSQLHREAKAKAALLGISLRELCIRAITDYLKRH